MTRRLLLLLGTVGLFACRSQPLLPVRPRPAPAASSVAKGDRLRWEGRFDAAAASYRRATTVDPGELRAYIGLQRIALLHGLDLEARRKARKSKHPYLAARLEGDRGRQEVELERAGEPWRTLGRAALLEEDGDFEEAIDRYQELLQKDPGLLAARLGLGRAALDAGRIGLAEEAFRAAEWVEPDHPEPAAALSLIQDRRGDYAGALAWALVADRRAPANTGYAYRVDELARRSGKPEILRRAAKVLLSGEGTQGVAALLAGSLLARAGDEAASEAAFRRALAKGALRSEVAAEKIAVPPRGLADFLSAFAEGVLARYRHYAATGEAQSFEGFQDWAYRLYEKKTGESLPPPAEPTHFAFVGDVVDPSASSPDPLVRRLAARGLLLVLGRRSGGPPEALLARVVRREGPAAVKVRNTTVRREAIYIDHRIVPGYTEWSGGGDIAGLALAHVVILDLDAVARWEGSVKRRCRRLQPDRKRILDAPALADRPVTALDDPAGVADRLFLESPLDFEGEVLVHENAHLVDADRFLPVWDHPLKDLGLALRHGFRAESILAFLERNAQLTAIAEGPAPREALAVCCSDLGAKGPHADGYTEIVGGFVDEIADHPERYPEIDPKRVLVQQLHRLPAKKVRAIAKILEERWGVSED